MLEPITMTDPTERYVLLERADGLFVASDGARPPSQMSDAGLWRSSGDSWVNAADDSLLNPSEDLHRVPGPDRLLSTLAAEFSTQGWICLPGILDKKVVDELRLVAGDQVGVKQGGLTERAAVAQAVAEPVSLWLCQQYLGSTAIKIAHPPSIAVVGQDDGQRDVQGWHSDYPYLWGITDAVPQIPSELILGVQRNVCITDFSRDNGATMFVLGSHKKNSGPPQDWGLQRHYGRSGFRLESGLPYQGEGDEAVQVIEAPAGSILLYDARTWHRQGIGCVPDLRAAMLQAMVPAYVAPFYDTAEEYEALCQAAFYLDLTRREKEVLSQLLVHARPTGS
ncbi:MAG: phytanoyl-CoA dioxygenase family protein [Pseudomonadota bacterium]